MSRGRHRTQSQHRAIVLVALVGLLVLGSCSSGRHGAATTSSTSTTTTTPGSTGNTPTGSIALANGVRLSKGEATTAGSAAAIPLVNGAPIDDAAARAVTDRLPAWTHSDDIAQMFKWPTETRPPPRTGATVDVPFPAANDTPPVDVPNGPLHVLRVQPEGDVAIAPFVTITFDQPMVPITTVGQLDAANEPATITPDVPGRWQWIGTKTLRFDATSAVVDRLPMATQYVVTVPAGTTSATGGVLADATTFNFSTPPVTVQSLAPTGDSLALVPVFVASFDQRVDPQAVLDTITLKADGDSKPIRLATAAEIDADDAARQQAAYGEEGRWIAFRPVDPLPVDASLTIEVGPGTPSAEGPLSTTKPVSYSAHTYSALRVTSVDCNYGPQCPPSTDISIGFNNELDPKLFDPATVVVDPAIPGAVIGTYGNVVVIRGATQANTTYSITLPGGLTDIHGQTLGQDTAETVHIGEAAPVLEQFSQPLITTDPLAAKPTISVRTVNHHDFHLSVFAVQPSDWSTYMQYVMSIAQGGNQNDDDLQRPPFQQVDDEIINVDGDPQQLSETQVDLSKEIGAAHGHVVVLIETTEHYDINGNDYWANRPTIAWVQATSIGLDAIADSDDLRTWTTDLTTGAPIEGVSVSFVNGPGAGVTDAEGLATLTLTQKGVTAVLATKGDDTALLPSSYYGSWQSQGRPDESRWYVFDDRQTYRPGEKVSVKGWVRRLTSSTDSQIQLFAENVTVSYMVNDNQGNVIANGEAAVNPLGGFDMSFAIPADANLGYATVSFTLVGASALSNGGYVHNFQIQEFRRPTFEVEARHESDGPYRRGAPITVAADADYYAGGPLVAAPVEWQVTTAGTTYSPPGWDEFAFGVWTPWWIEDFGRGSGMSDVVTEGPCCFPGGTAETKTFSGITDASGTDYLQIDVGNLDPSLDGLPITVSANAAVTDVDRQTLASTTDVLVHPADFYVGLRSDHPYVNRGDKLTVDAIVTDIDGKAVAGRAVRVKASRSESVFQQGQWVDKQVDEQTCDITSDTTAVVCTFPMSVGGTYTVTATVADDRGRSSRTELTRWVSGAVEPPRRNVEQQSLTIVPDQSDFAPGTSAHLLVQAPFNTGHGLLTVSRSGIVSTSTFEVAEGTALVDVPINNNDIPNLDVSIEVVGVTPRVGDDGTPLPDGPPRPAFAAGAITLPISTATRALTVTATPQSDAVAPGADTQINVTVTDSAGAPAAGSDVAVVVVDEAVLALSGYQLQNPLEAFYTPLYSYLSTQYGRQSIVLADPATLSSNPDDGQTSATTAAPAPAAESPLDTAPGSRDESAAGAAATADGAYQSTTGTPGAPIDVRTNFDALAVFSPSVTTDAAGHATVAVPLPDNLTRYRVMAVAAHGAEQFGSGEANITARLPLMVRPSAPRFLNFGDTFELPVVVQNQTDAAMDVDVVVQTDNLTLTGANALHVSVPANDRVEVRFPAAAAQAGIARFRVAVASGDLADAATTELPVYTPATAEAFATYGVIDDGATLQPIQTPTDVVPQFGGLDVTTSSTSLQALTDAVLYISEYPYQSTDAVASQILAISSLGDVLDAFDAPGLPSKDVLNTAVTDGIDRLVSLQNDDGGFPYWERGRQSDPFNSIQATQALLVAREGGFRVPTTTTDSALQFLKDIDQHIPSTYDETTRQSLEAYALSVRMLAGDRDTATANALFDQHRDQLPLDAIAWLWPVVDDSHSAAIEKIVGNRAVDTAGAVTFTTEASDSDYLTLRSDRRTDGLILDALIEERPQSDMIPKVVAGLLGGQTQGRWNNIQENSFILLALHSYFEAFESQTPDFVARVWLGDRFAGEHDFDGRSTDRARLSIPTADLLTTGDADLTIVKEGTGRLYYRIGLRTAPSDLQLDPLDRGFVVARTYEGVDDPADVTRDADGTWHIKSGAKVRVRLTMVAESQRTHVALIDPLPAGLEILNPALATTQVLPPDEEGGRGTDEPYYGDSWWYPTWFDHQNIRDDRAEAFASWLGAGVYDYSYVTKATTPGSFVVPPVRAEEMYEPETFGRGATDTVVIAG